jgi:hypothetical protein
MQTVIFTLAYHFGGLSPFAFHLVSLLLHILTTVIVYLLLDELGVGLASPPGGGNTFRGSPGAHGIGFMDSRSRRCGMRPVLLRSASCGGKVRSPSA